MMRCSGESSTSSESYTTPSCNRFERQSRTLPSVARTEVAMPDEKPSKGEIGVGLLSLFPPAIRASVLEDESFRQRFELAVDAVVRLDQSGLNLDRSKLFGAIRDLLGAKPSNVEVTSRDGIRWKVAFSENKESIVLIREGAEIALPDFSYLSPDSAR